MAKSYRIWDEGYIYKFEVLDEQDPVIWALKKQSEGYQVEVGTMDWVGDKCGWKWEKKIVELPPEPNEITEQIFNSVWDMKGNTQRVIAEKLGVKRRTISDILNLKCHIYKEYYRKRNETH